MSSSGTTDLRGGLKAWLARPSALVASVVLGTALTLPSLTTGLAADDWLHLASLRGIHTVATPSMRGLDLFRFANGDPKTAQSIMDAGDFPWATNPHAKLAFWRPLTALTHALDQELWPNATWLAHLQNVVWLALGLAGAALLYRRVLGATWIAGLATLLYATDQTHGSAVGWIANRNALVALAIGLLAVWMHDRWRAGGWKPGAWLAPLTFGVALLSGESAIAVVAYVVAHLVCLDRSSWKSRAIAIAPYLVVVAVWSVAYSAQGYGASGSGVYIDPRSEPITFLASLPERLPLLLLAQVGMPWSDLGTLYHYVSPALTLGMVVFALAVLALGAYVATPLLKRDARARFFALGALLSAIPICATFPSDRLLLFVGFGALGLIAMFFEAATGALARSVVWALALVHLVLSPPWLALRSKSMNTVNAPILLVDQTIPKTPDIATKTVILVNPPSDVFGAYVPAMRAVKGEPRPLHMRVLASGTTSVTVERVDARTIRVHPARGFLERDPERMLRSRESPFAKGDTVELVGTSISVESITADGRPADVLFRFDVPLEDSSLVWLEWTPEGYSPLRVPGVGQTVELPLHDLLPAVLHAMEVEDRQRR